MAGTGKKVLPGLAKLRERGADWRRWYYYLLGIIGWILVIYNAPFGWDTPNYAAF